MRPPSIACAGTVFRSQRVAADAQVDVERFVVQSRDQEPNARFRATARRGWRASYEPAKLSAQEGALFIPAAQPLARLAFYLLEPESDDGLVDVEPDRGGPRGR